ncbi:thiaminase II [Thaumasiovibrio sp. DFM-14]|uniref:thiaminase II n=1 Tax=Thaumasiovibrio sp. DFM-14 TaxID=3384792 RepID=UPI0039A0C4F6
MNYLDLITACEKEWQAYTQHDFVKQLALGTLPQSQYLHYLQQDFLFLKHYARAYALAMFKADSLDEMRASLPSVRALLETEIAHHVNYCSQWGLTESDMEALEEDFGTVAYTRYVLDCGMQGDLLDLLVALAPCSLGYAHIGAQLTKEEALAQGTTALDNNPYHQWIEMYAHDDFQQGSAETAARLSRLLENIDRHSEQGKRLIKIFRTATRMEIAFWQQALDQ